MQNNIKLFENIDDADMYSMLDCLGAYSKSYEKNEFVVLAGDKLESVGVLLSGSINILKEDSLGGRHLKGTISKNEVFALSIVCARMEKSPVSAIANVDCSVLYLPLRKTLTTCSNGCSYHSQLVLNLVSLLAKTNMNLDKKIDYLLAKTVKQKIAKYLRDYVDVTGKMIFEIEFNRNDLAEFLGVDRSVLSRELSKMKKQEIFDFDKNTFKVLDYDTLFELAI